jgi:hypothetical protein
MRTEKFGTWPNIEYGKKKIQNSKNIYTTTGQLQYDFCNIHPLRENTDIMPF